MMDLIFTYNYLSFFNLLNFLKQMIILFVDFYNLTIFLNVDDFDYLEFLIFCKSQFLDFDETKLDNVNKCG
jgi:hypothetical protein